MKTGIPAVLLLILLSLSACDMGTGNTPPPIGEIPETPDSALDGTRWNYGGIPLEFVSPIQAKMSGQTYAYTYDDLTKTGGIAVLGPFVYDEILFTLTFTDYKGIGSQVIFQTLLDKTLVATKWRWGTALIQFTSANRATLRGKTYKYGYESATNRGSISGLGEFSLGDAETLLVFPSYRDYGRQLSFNRETADATVTINDTLVGTEWIWDSQWGHAFLVFMTETTSINGSYNDWYRYDPAARTGEVEYMGPFRVSADGKKLDFTNYGGYGHGAPYVVRE
jgi:hypothetical protein